MTLLVASQSEKHVVLTADGMSKLTKDGKARVSRLNLQKIFPVPNSSIAIIHHGENLIDGKPVTTILLKLFKDDSKFFGNPLPDVIADRIADELDSDVRATLSTIPDAKNCAFWICGFGRRRSKPSVIEIVWKKNNGNIEFNKQTAGDLFLGGNGQDYIRRYTKDPIDGQFHWRRLWKGTQKYHIRFHEKLWKLAEKRQNESSEIKFGGHKHRLIITPDSHSWETEPMNYAQQANEADR